MARQTIITCLYLAAIATLLLAVAVQAHNKKQDECIAKQKEFHKKEEECWKKECPDQKIPPPIECSLTKQASMELIIMLNLLVQANVTKTMPTKFGPRLTDIDRKAIFKCISDAALSLKIGADKARKAKDIKDEDEDDDDFALLDVLAAATDAVVKPPPNPLDLRSFLQKQLISLDIEGDIISKYVQMISTLTTQEKPRIGPARSTILQIARSIGPPDHYIEDHDPSVESLFFPAAQLKQGMKLSLQFSKTINTAPFFDITGFQGGMPGTISAALLIDLLVAAMSPPTDLSLDTNAIDICNTRPTGTSDKICPLMACATDLESMLSFITTQLGKEVHPCTAPTTAPPNKLDYTITGFKKLPELQSVACAKMVCPVALYMCQHMPKAITYSVSLQAADGTTMETPCLCHQDTKTWNAQSWIFNTLKSKPGECGVCHFLAADDITWMPKPPAAAAGGGLRLNPTAV